MLKIIPKNCQKTKNIYAKRVIFYKENRACIFFGMIPSKSKKIACDL